MTILNSGTRNQYVATSGQTVFNYNFEITVAADIVVYQGDTLLALTTNYTLTGLGVDTGGTVTLVTGATTGDIITVYRFTAAERLTDYQNSGDFLSDEVNSDFDRLWAVIQENTTSSDFFLQLKQTTALTLPFELDEPVASNILRYKSDLSGIESAPLSAIPDADDASDLSYSNAGSTLSATNTEAAIDELDAEKANLSGAAFTGAISTITTNTPLSDAAATLTAAQLIGGEFTITPTVARIQTTDTAANIIAAMADSVDDSSFNITMINLAAFDVTIAAGTGVTLVGNMVVNNGNATFRVRRLTATAVSVTRKEGRVADIGGVFIARDQKTVGTSGGAPGANTVVRTLNTVLVNTISGASLTASRPTLPAGTFKITATAPVYEGGQSKAYIYNYTDSAHELSGSSVTVVNGTQVSVTSVVMGIVTLASAKELELKQYFTILPGGTSVLGLATNNAASSVEVYAQIEIEQIG
jgi:hypothetical protein